MCRTRRINGIIFRMRLQIRSSESEDHQVYETFSFNLNEVLFLKNVRNFTLLQDTTYTIWNVRHYMTSSIIWLKYCLYDIKHQIVNESFIWRFLLYDIKIQCNIFINRSKVKYYVHIKIIQILPFRMKEERKIQKKYKLLDKTGEHSNSWQSISWGKR